MSDYENIRIKKLVLKGDQVKKNKKRKKDKELKTQNDDKKKKYEVDEDTVSHGGWWPAKATGDINGNVAIEFGHQCYLKALDNGLFTLGAPHTSGEGPHPEEIFTAFPIKYRKVSFKSGYGKYLKVEKDGMVTGRSEAVGSTEQWEPVFENSQMALLSDTGHFMSIDPEDEACVALRKKVGEHEVCRVRSNALKDLTVEQGPVEDKVGLGELEKNYVKKYQKFQNKKMQINQNDVKELEVAKTKGTLHETLLDRRSKMKADRYCK